MGEGPSSYTAFTKYVVASDHQYLHMPKNSLKYAQIVKVEAHLNQR